MNKRPNAFQKILHRIAMMRPVTEFFSTKMNRLDEITLKITKGKHTISELAGWPIIQITTTGAKTGKLHTLMLVGLFDEEKIALIASGFGRVNNPAWYYNLIAHPKCDVQFNGHSGTYVARETHGDEREKYWQMALSYYKGYDLYRKRAAKREIPVMILEPVK
jgi:deazaflavin-dependent oxidoreductase (nitroreductase family)